VTTATSDTATLEAEAYLKQVAPHLAALPPDERADLLDDLAQHLQEIAAEPGPPLEERLGSPEAYAAELLASAGVEARPLPGPPLLTRAAALFATVRGSWLGQEAERMWPVLRPAWWVIRAYLAVSLFSVVERNGTTGFAVPSLAGSHTLGLLGVLVAIPLSVRLGRRRLPRSGRLAVVGANAILALYALTLLGRAGTPEIRYVDYGPPVTRASQGCLSTAAGERITNLYAYDADGRLLDPVLLYDQDGQPIDNLCPEFDDRGRRLNTEYRQDANGAPVINAFPRRQTATVDTGRPPAIPGGPVPAPTVPVKPPAVVVPRLAPPAPPTTAATPATPAG
jgi:hypothetical protein